MPFDSSSPTCACENLNGTPFSGIVFSLQAGAGVRGERSQPLRIMEPFTGAARFDMHVVFVPGRTIASMDHRLQPGSLPPFHD